MKIAIPLVGGKLSQHFGHCEEFVLLEICADAKTITGKSLHQPPPHEPGMLPRWLNQLGAEVIIAGGMGRRAQELFTETASRWSLAQQRTPLKSLLTPICRTLWKSEKTAAITDRNRPPDGRNIVVAATKMQLISQCRF